MKLASAISNEVKLYIFKNKRGQSKAGFSSVPLFLPCSLKWDIPDYASMWRIRKQIQILWEMCIFWSFAYWHIFPSTVANSLLVIRVSLERQPMQEQELGFASVIGKEQNVYSYDLQVTLSYHLGKSLPKFRTSVFSNILVSAPYTFLKIIAHPKELLFMWIKSTNMYHIRT